MKEQISFLSLSFSRTQSNAGQETVKDARNRKYRHNHKGKRYTALRRNKTRTIVSWSGNPATIKLDTLRSQVATTR